MKITYIAVPIGDLSSPHWRSCMALPSGDSIVVIGLLLRDLAVQIGRGGKLLHPSGAPMHLSDLAGILSRSGLDIEYSVAALSRIGLLRYDGVTLTVLDSVVRDHLVRVKPLLIDDKTKRNKALAAARQKRFRQKKKLCDGEVTLETLKDVTQIERYGSRDMPNNTASFACNDTTKNNYKIINNNKVAVVEFGKEGMDFDRMWKLIPTKERSKRLKEIIIQALQTPDGGGPEAIEANIYYAIKKHRLKAKDGSAQTLGGLLCIAISEDYTSGARREAAEQAAKIAETNEQWEYSAAEYTNKAERVCCKARTPENEAVARAALAEIKTKMGIT